MTTLSAEHEIVGTAPFRFRRMIDRETIADNMRRLAVQLRMEYQDKNPILIGVLNGCFIFMADLIREMAVECEVDFIKLSSYRENMQSGDIELRKDVDADLRNRHVLLVEDIVDTGNSLAFLRRHLNSKGAASFAIASMFVKPNAVRPGTVIEYVGMEIPNDFVVGYGLDYAQQWRQLPDLHVLMKDE